MQIEILIADSDQLEDTSLFNTLIQCVSEERKQKIYNYRFKSGQNLSLAAGCLLHSLLKEKNISSRMALSEYGKPYLLDNQSLKFNISHSGHYAICCSSNLEIGCDIEKIDTANMKIAKRFFSASEYDYLSNIKDRSKLDYQFTRLWTLKESFIKALGLGLSVNLRDFSISISDSVKVNQNINTNKYFFYESNLLTDYNIAVCSLEDFSEKPCIRFIDLRNIPYV